MNNTKPLKDLSPTNKQNLMRFLTFTIFVGLWSVYMLLYFAMNTMICNTQNINYTCYKDSKIKHPFYSKSIFTFTCLRIQIHYPSIYHTVNLFTIELCIALWMNDFLNKDNILILKF